MQVTQTVNLAPLSILIIDDNRHMRTVLSTILKSVGVHQFCEADNGADALERLRRYPIDIGIVDYNMMHIDGIEFTKIVRRATDSANPYLPLIMVSGHSERTRITDARDAGVNEFIVKPLNAKALLERVINVIIRPRPFVRCSSYFGPDRRRRSTGQYCGPYRRVTDSTS